MGRLLNKLDPLIGQMSSPSPSPNHSVQTSPKLSNKVHKSRNRIWTGSDNLITATPAPSRISLELMGITIYAAIYYRLQVSPLSRHGEYVPLNALVELREVDPEVDHRQVLDLILVSQIDLDRERNIVKDAQSH